MDEIPIVLIGHKDHGKSTLIGRLLLDTKSIKESRLKEVKEVDESFGQKFELAHLVDSFKEERQMEMTMDTTRALLKGKQRNYELIDVPGHAELISNMLTGASAAQGALLMVSIKEGIEEQTKQHLEIAKLLGIEQIGVVVNKMDFVEYRQDTFNMMVERLKKILMEIGYLAKDIHFFPVSAKEGDNVVFKSKNTPWYKGKTVMEFLESEIKDLKDKEESEILSLQDKYMDLLIGRVESGTIKKGKKYLFLPENIESSVTLIKDSEGELEEAKNNQNVGIETPVISDVGRGTVVVSLNGNKMKRGNDLSGEIFWIASPSKKNLSLECGTAQVEAELIEPKETGQWVKTAYRISLKRPIAFEPGGRTIWGKIILKENGKIIAVGNIL